jgi:hypothetical protein
MRAHAVSVYRKREAAMRSIVESVGQMPAGIYGGSNIIRNIAGFEVGIRGYVTGEGIFKLSTSFIIGGG